MVKFIKRNRKWKNRDINFEETNTIQAQSILYILQGRYVIGQVPTGTGKTAT